MVQLVGVVTVGEPMVMVVEFMEHGSLKSWLEVRAPTAAQQLQWAGDVAAGLAHVHGKGFLHRDVAARNVLLSSALRAKVGDFGLARELDLDANYYRSRGGQIPVRWTAPEALVSRRFSPATDVWAFGVLLHELWTRAATPYWEWSHMQVWVAVTEGYVLEQVAECADEVYDVMVRCWARVPKERPSMAEVERELRRLAGGEPLAPSRRASVVGVRRRSRLEQDQSYADSAPATRSGSQVWAGRRASGGRQYEYVGAVGVETLMESEVGRGGSVDVGGGEGHHYEYEPLSEAAQRAAKDVGRDVGGRRSSNVRAGANDGGLRGRRGTSSVGTVR